MICTVYLFLGSSYYYPLEVQTGGDNTLLRMVTCYEVLALESLGVVVSIESNCVRGMSSFFMPPPPPILEN